MTTTLNGPWRILVVDDDLFIAALVADGLRLHSHLVTVAASPREARLVVAAIDPHLLICDLNFVDGQSGAQFVSELRSASPWVACVILSSHRSPELAVADAHLLPDDVVYLVKSMVRSVAHILEAAHAAITGRTLDDPSDRADGGTVLVNETQAQVIRMLASGASTRAIAELRGTSVRAVESLLVRLYNTLGLDVSPESNPRVDAVRLWQSGRVLVRRLAGREATIVS